MTGLKRMVSKASAELRQSFEAADKSKLQEQMADKFKVVTMSTGRIDDFHAGLSGRVGSPHLDFENACEAEHCIKAGGLVQAEDAGQWCK